MDWESVPYYYYTGLICLHIMFIIWYVADVSRNNITMGSCQYDMRVYWSYVTSVGFQTIFLVYNGSYFERRQVIMISSGCFGKEMLCLNQ